MFFLHELSDSFEYGCVLQQLLVGEVSSLCVHMETFSELSLDERIVLPLVVS